MSDLFTQRFKHVNIDDFYSKSQVKAIDILLSVSFPDRMNLSSALFSSTRLANVVENNSSLLPTFSCRAALGDNNTIETP